jgi:hypothetical protein
MNWLNERKDSLKERTVALALAGLLGCNAVAAPDIQAWYRMGESGTLG